MFKRKYIFGLAFMYYGLLISSAILIYGPTLCLLIYFLLKINVLRGFLVLLSLIYCFTLGKTIGISFRETMISVENKKTRDFLVGGKYKIGYKLCRFMHLRARLTTKKSKYHMTFKYKEYNNSFLIDTKYDKNEKELLEYGSRNLLSDNIYMIFEFFQALFFKHLINEEYEKAMSLLKTMINFSPDQLNNGNGIVVKHTSEHHYSLIFPFAERDRQLHERAIKKNVSKFKPFYDYWADPSDENYRFVIDYCQGFYAVRKLYIYIALYKITQKVKRDNHRIALLRDIFDIETDLPIKKYILGI